MDNKKRNEKILQLTCELLEKMNFEVEKAFVEDVEEERHRTEGDEDRASGRRKPLEACEQQRTDTQRQQQEAGRGRVFGAAGAHRPAGGGTTEPDALDRAPRRRRRGRESRTAEGARRRHR